MTPNRVMRIRQAAGGNRIEAGEAEVRAPGPGEVMVRVHAVSLNFRDGLVARGVFPVRDGLVPLSDAAGEVMEAGAGVADLAVGDRVVSVFHPNWRDGHVERSELNNSPGGPADGFACDYATRPASHFIRAPAALGHTASATLPCAGVTAWRALVVDGGVHPGARVLVLGTGGVAIFALQFAKAAGATVIATSSSADKLDRLRALGADHVIDYSQIERWGDAVLELTGGIGVDHIVETGGPRTLPDSLVAARTGAHVAIIGATAGFEIDTMPFAIVQAKRLRLQAVTVGSRRDQLEMVRAIETLGIEPVVGARFPLERLIDAFECLAGARRPTGKIVVDVAAGVA